MDENLKNASLLDQYESHDEWTRARRGALIQGVICAFKNCSVDLIPFDDVKSQLQLIHRQSRGLQDIELDNIRGSVGRYRDFTSAFLPRRSHMRQRWERINSMVIAQGMSPIEVYQVGGAYFVVDGNHRVSIARQAGMRTIPAYVYEYPTPVGLSAEADLDELITKSEYLEFLRKTKLDKLRPGREIIFTAPGRYKELECLISMFRETLEQPSGEPVTEEEALLSWFDLIYLPAVQIISESGALERFSDRTEADLFIWMWQHQDRLQDHYSPGFDIGTGGTGFISLLRRLWRNVRKLI